MGHLLTEMLLLLAAAALAGLGLGWALFHRTTASASTQTAAGKAPSSRELEEARKALREAEARTREADGRTREAAERTRHLEGELARAVADVARVEAAAQAARTVPPPAESSTDEAAGGAAGPDASRSGAARVAELEAEVAELRAALATNAPSATANTTGAPDATAWAGMRTELEQALAEQTRLERQLAELEVERERNRQTLLEQEVTLDSLSQELAGRPRNANPATKVVGAATPGRTRTQTLSTMRAAAPGKGAGGRPSVAGLPPLEDSSPIISVRPASGRGDTLAEGSPPRAPENPRPATVRQARIDTTGPQGASVSPPALPPSALPPAASSGVAVAAGGSRATGSEVEGLRPDESTVSISLVDLVGRIDAASERSSGSAPGSSEPASASVTAAPPPPDEATVALDVFALVGRIDATTDAGDDDGEDDPPPAPPRELAFADASATIQQQRPSFLEGEDLKILKGVGPVIELRMREFGITSWRSLADLDEDGLDRLADHLKMTPERVRPWADQARGLTASDVASDDPSEAP